MAKKTKDSNLSIEERLEQALIPNWDEPYKLPENWCWLQLLSAFENCTDSKKKIQQKDYLESGLWSVVDQGQSLVGGYTNDETMLYNGNLPVVIFGDHTRCVKYIDFNFAQGADGVKVLRPKSFYHPKFFFYALLNVDIPNLGYRRHYPLFDKFSIPLAPWEEQKRIVEQIEFLFARLDEAKEKAQEVVDGFETRKAAILHKAFSGELTKIWREDNQIGFDTWALFDLQSVCCTSITDGTHKTPIYSDAVNGIPFLSSKDVTSEKINWENIKYIDAKLHEELYARLAPQKDDVLLAKNGTTGVAALVDVDKVFDIYVTLAVLRPNKKIINPKYLYRIVNSPLCKTQFNEHLTGIGVPNLHLRDIKKVIINVPTLLEQEIIVNILDNLISKEQQAKEAAESVIEQIEIIKKAILARAFRGELSTNDPSEESALELLKSVLMGNTNQTGILEFDKKSTGIPVHIEAALFTKLEKKIVGRFYATKRSVVSVDEIMSVSSKRIDIINTLIKLEQRGILVRLNNSYYRIKE